MLLHALLAFKVSAEESDSSLMNLALNVTMLCLVNLTIICHEEGPFWSYLFDMLNGFCIWVCIPFSIFGNFLAIILVNRFSVPSACSSSPSDMLMSQILDFLKHDVLEILYVLFILSFVKKSSF